MKEKAKTVQCPLCNGYGTLPSDSNLPESCWFCDGKGRLEMVRLEVAEKEIDKEKAVYHVLWEKYSNLLELFQSLMQLACEYYDDTQNERLSIKHKLQELFNSMPSLLEAQWTPEGNKLFFEFKKKFEELLREK